ncbi:Uncharacterized GTP-binding protein YjiA [Cronobacter sakazakii]|nr:Uncharacterized GTP-binding protein YjiA [Cronobacter sakazakii]
MLEERIVQPAPRFHFAPPAQTDITSIVVNFDYPVALDAVSRVMEELLLEFADNLMRYKGMLYIQDEPRRLLFQGVQRLYSADWDREWASDETPHSNAGVYRRASAGRRDPRRLCIACAEGLSLRSLRSGSS